MSNLPALLVTGIAEGRFGEGPKKVYWWLSGKKTYIGLAFGLAWALLEYGSSSGTCGKLGYDCSHISSVLGQVAMFLLAVGLYDGAIRTTAPVAPAASPKE